MARKIFDIIRVIYSHSNFNISKVCLLYLFEGDNLTGEFAYTYYFCFICYEVVNLYMYRLICYLEDISKDYTDTRVRLRNFFQNVKNINYTFSFF